MSKPELLAPAGCFASLQAAIDAGADSVYFGVEQLNMRTRARRHFWLDDIAEISERCHAAGIRAYLTLNTLLYDHDAELATSILQACKTHNVDAVIVSDMAAVQVANRLGVEVHLSTQLSISNFSALQFYAQFCDRVVLARELNLNMIKKISTQIQTTGLKGRSGRPMELEVFAHGALCVAVSGRCGMSLYTNNASANRGACEQNCRKEYKVTDVDSGQELKIENNYVMSPSDLSTIDFLDKIIDAGVSVLKLEGRARAPEYVSSVTAAYRKALTAIDAGTYGETLVTELLEDLKAVYNRGLSSGYYLGRDQKWSGKYGSHATQTKVALGKVLNYYPKMSVALVEVQAGQISVGDQYAVIGNASGVVKGQVEALWVDDQPAATASIKQQFTVKVPARVRINDGVFLLKDTHVAHQT